MPLRFVTKIDARKYEKELKDDHVNHAMACIASIQCVSGIGTCWHLSRRAKMHVMEETFLKLLHDNVLGTDAAALALLLAVAIQDARPGLRASRSSQWPCSKLQVSRVGEPRTASAAQQEVICSGQGFKPPPRVDSENEAKTSAATNSGKRHRHRNVTGFVFAGRLT